MSADQLLATLSPEQEKPVFHPVEQPELVLAGAGSGKTRVMTARVHYLLKQDINPRSVVTITFTNKAADELRHRLGFGDDPKVGPRVSTIHSLALNAIRIDPRGFGLATSKVTPLDEGDQKDMLRRLIENRKKDPKFHELDMWKLKEKLGYHRARGVGFAVDYTPEVHKLAEKAHRGYHAMTEAEILLWKDYEEAKTQASVVDFDDMLHLVVRRGQIDDVWRSGIQRQFRHVLMDEAQDTNPVQWQFVEMLLDPNNHSLCAVGDLSQCQPPGTLVRVVVVPPRGSLPAVVEDRPIETLRDGDRVVAWDKHVQISYSAGRTIRVAQRPYAGPLVSIGTAHGSTECTPNHWNWVRFNENTQGKHLVYLMHREDLGFRVGISVFKRATTGGRRGAYGLSYRFNQEKADRAWILRVCDSRVEAEAWEEIYSVKYGIPESLFEPEPCLHKTRELIQLVFSHANPRGGHLCLQDHNLLWTHPLVERTAKGTHGNSWRGFFRTAAANILPGLMDIPIPGRNCSTPVTAISRRDYTGPVYSLDVERDHTYVADGLVVGNSIYAFNGAAPEILGGMVAGWRGVVPVTYKLEDNYRSLGKVVRFANRIQKTMTGTVPLQMNVKRLEAEGYEGAVTLIREGTDRDIAERIAETIARDARLKTGKFKFRDNALLVRSASQIPALEDALVRCRIPYIVRGGQGLFQTEEARDLFAYLKLVVNPSDVMAFKRAVGTPKRGLGDVAVEKLQKTALAKFEGDLVRAAQNSDHMVLRPFGDFIGDLGRFENPVDALHKLISRIDYRGLIRDRYKKNPEAQERKLGNLDRILEALKGLVESSPNGTASFADIIFRVTMDSKAEAASDDGVVVISTIHNAKGLEWPRVYVTNIYEGSLPHQWSSSEKEVEEERRLFYVAVTRARDVCGLCVPTTVSRGPNVVRVQPSRFLVELGIIQ